MPRGRQYYDPIIQAPSKVESAGNRRVELYPEQDIRDNVASLRWVARLVGDDGLIVQYSPGSFDHDDALRQAKEMWSGLEVYELREESEDSTHEGMGPSPRLWQPAGQFSAAQWDAQSRHIAKEFEEMRQEDVTPAVEEHDATIHRLAEGLQAAPDGARQLRAIVAADPGAYVHLDDIVLVLEDYAVQYDEMNNPSGALALREAAAALSEPF